jgi:hypothetical protein
MKLFLHVPYYKGSTAQYYKYVEQIAKQILWCNPKATVVLLHPQAGLDVTQRDIRYHVMTQNELDNLVQFDYSFVFHQDMAWVRKQNLSAFRRKPR